MDGTVSPDDRCEDISSDTEKIWFPEFRKQEI